METTFQPPTDEIIEARNKIKELEEKINWLETDNKDKMRTISIMEKNMERLYVENWTVTDSDGKKGVFSGMLM